MPRFDADTHFELGAAYAENGLLADAIAELEEALVLDPQHVAARAALLELRLRVDPPKEGAPS